MNIYNPFNISGHPFILTHHWVVPGTDCHGKDVELIGDQKGCQVFTSLMENRHDFPFNTHPLAETYGLGDFVVISPAGNEMLTTESRVHVILSSITMAISNIQRFVVEKEEFNCYVPHSFILLNTFYSRVPVFVQIHSKSSHLYQGMFESKNHHLQTDFQMAYLHRIPEGCKHLSGLILVLIMPFK